MYLVLNHVEFVLQKKQGSLVSYHSALLSLPWRSGLEILELLGGHGRAGVNIIIGGHRSWTLTPDLDILFTHD